MGKKKLSPEEEAWGAAAHIHKPPLKRLFIGLDAAARSYATGKYNSESAAVAVAATIGFIKRISPRKHLLAPLYEVLEIVEATIDPAYLPNCRRHQAIVMDVEAGRPPPPREIFARPGLSVAASSKVAGCVAVEFQRRNGASIKDALAIVAEDSAAALKLKNFRYNMLEKDSPKHARGYYFEWLQMISQKYKGNPKLLAEKSLQAYRNSLGKKS
jgi:hypothetical protein